MIGEYSQPSADTDQSLENIVSPVLNRQLIGEYSQPSADIDQSLENTINPVLNSQLIGEYSQPSADIDHPWHLTDRGPHRLPSLSVNALVLFTSTPHSHDGREWTRGVHSREEFLPRGDPPLGGEPRGKNFDTSSADNDWLGGESEPSN